MEKIEKTKDFEKKGRGRLPKKNDIFRDGEKTGENTSVFGDFGGEADKSEIFRVRAEESREKKKNKISKS